MQAASVAIRTLVLAAKSIMRGRAEARSDHRMILLIKD
jgi:hypothetical protein